MTFQFTGSYKMNGPFFVQPSHLFGEMKKAGVKISVFMN